VTLGEVTLGEVTLGEVTLGVRRESRGRTGQKRVRTA
jgi:hypothetical protein